MLTIILTYIYVCVCPIFKKRKKKKERKGVGRGKNQPFVNASFTNIVMEPRWGLAACYTKRPTLEAVAAESGNRCFFFYCCCCFSLMLNDQGEEGSPYFKAHLFFKIQKNQAILNKTKRKCSAQNSCFILKYQPLAPKVAGKP